jgi:glycosyltransferase involved in cell wall biosynthesis
MKILMIACAYKCTGVGDYTEDLKSALERATDAKVDLLSGNCICVNKRAPSFELYKCVYIGNDKIPRSIERLLKGFSYLAYSNIEKPEIIHYQCDYGSFGASQLFQLASLKQQKLVVTVHEIQVGPGRIPQPVSHLLWRLILKKVDSAIVHSQYTRKVLHEISKRHNIVVIPHGVFLGPLLNLTRQEITFLGTLDYRRKGFLTLLEAVRILKKDFGKNINLGVYGSYSYTQTASVKPLIEKYGLSNNVHFGGKLASNEFLKKIAESLFVVAPYIDSNASGIILKSMAQGTPIVSTSVGSIPEYVGKAGILVPPANPYKLAEGMNEMLNDKKKRIAMGNEGLRRVREIYSWEKVALQTYQLYKQVLES